MTVNVEEILERSQALLKGHFLLTSGLHSPVYWEKARVLQYPEYTEKLCGMIAGHFRERRVQVVAGPTVPGIILAYETARQLGARAIFAERDEAGGRVFRRGFNIAPGERVLIVDDILTTGGSVREVMDAVRHFNGDIVGVGVMVDRAEVPVDLGVPLYSCHRMAVINYRPENCPLCARGVPLVKPGSSQRQPGK